ncbi:fatty acyl-AMP ligase [Elongatibacter sediminis]|uniref:Fatty acyl-AMP ligase n=1 Tax=Elongatibacter sediminis TaxID=3119006 RepID=A0AAW9R7N9_9GAMM
MTSEKSSSGIESTELRATPVNRKLELRCDGFSGLADALEYAATGDTGFNFYGHNGQLEHILSYRDLYDEARTLARRLAGLGCPRGTRVGIVAETDPLFHRFFFACQFAGLVPVAVPAGVNLGAHQAYVSQVRRMLDSCGARIAVAPESHADLLAEVVEPLDLVMSGTPEQFDGLPQSSDELIPATGTDLAYLQYTSGSTRFPRGVEIDQRTVLENLRQIALNGLRLDREDRFVSWLPFYHDMGMIGFILVPLIAQLSADYIASRTFAMRPRLWLKLISDNRGTISSSPTFGYALCARRLRPSDYERYDLRSWRAACVGAEQIKPAPLQAFAEALAPCGFDARAFTACYGMAESVLAVSFAPLGQGLQVDRVDSERMAREGIAAPVAPDSPNAAAYVDCGIAVPGFELDIRDDAGNTLGERQCGRIFLRGPSVMGGYFDDPEATSQVLAEDGWLDTGDIGYRFDDRLVITARSKDVIIIKGRNIWPHDMETLVERQEAVRLGGVAAFAISRESDEDQAVIVVETRDRDPDSRERLVHSIWSLMHEHFGINVVVDLVKPGTLPRTSSGKLSRSLSRQGYFERKGKATDSRPTSASSVRRTA